MDIDEKHDRVIIHIDIDCFYAQVEMNKNPELREKPMGIQQKNIVVTCNYPARARGVGKCMYIPEAMKKCPELVLVNGEDLADYRKVSSSVYSTLCETGSPVERLGMDENWLDVTQMVKVRLQELNGAKPTLRGHTFGDFSCNDCECINSLTVGTAIAEELRNTLKEKFNLTTSAGIAHNKQLSKMVGGKNKPDDQTVISSAAVLELLTADMAARSVPGIGKRTAEQLAAAGLDTLGDIREVSMDKIETAGILRPQALLLKKMAWGQDDTEVKMTGRPQSVGLEDRFMGLYTEAECRDKMCWLLDRLTQLLVDDGRKPTLIKVTVRDYYKDKLVKKFHKESRQGKVSARLFHLDKEGNLSSEHKTEILDIAVGLLGKMVDFADSFHITLMGLSVSNFLDEVEKKGSIKNFFISPKKEGGLPQSVPTSFVKRKNLFDDDATTEPDTKKPKTSGGDKTVDKKEVKGTLFSLFNKSNNNGQRKAEKSDGKQDVQIASNSDVSTSCEPVTCPAGYDPEVWSQLPPDLRHEMMAAQSSSSSGHSTNSSGGEPIVPAPSDESKIYLKSSASTHEEMISFDSGTSNQNKEDSQESNSENPEGSTSCPPGVDLQVFNELPQEIRSEIRQSITKKTQVSLKNSKNQDKMHKKKSVPKSQSILNFFTRQK